MLHSAQPPSRMPAPPPLPRTPSPSGTWSRYPAPDDALYFAPRVSAAPRSPRPWLLGEPLTSIPLRRVDSPPLVLAENLDAEDPPHPRGHRVFIWTLRSLCGAMALAVPGAIIWFALRARPKNG